MGINHTTIVLWEIVPPWIHIILGFTFGIAFPIMAFFVVEGFRRTSNVKRYMLRLLVFGAIAQIPYTVAFGIWQLNVVFSILLGLICIIMHEKLYVEKERKGLFVVLFILILIASLITVESGPFGLIMIFLYKVIKDEMKRRTVTLVVWGAFMVFVSLMTRVLTLMVDVLGDVLGKYALDAYVLETTQMTGTIMEHSNMMLQFFTIPIGTFLIIPLLRAYNGELGRRAKYLFYTFYPMHFVILILIAWAIGLRVPSIPAFALMGF